MILEGWETARDKEIIRLVEGATESTVVYFHPITTTPGDSFYWHIRIKGRDGVVFIRQNDLGEVYMYGPVKATCIG